MRRNNGSVVIGQRSRSRIFPFSPIPSSRRRKEGRKETRGGSEAEIVKGQASWLSWLAGRGGAGRDNNVDALSRGDEASSLSALNESRVR